MLGSRTRPKRVRCRQGARPHPGPPLVPLQPPAAHQPQRGTPLHSAGGPANRPAKQHRRILETHHSALDLLHTLSNALAQRMNYCSPSCRTKNADVLSRIVECAERGRLGCQWHLTNTRVWARRTCTPLLWASSSELLASRARPEHCLDRKGRPQSYQPVTSSVVYSLFCKLGCKLQASKKGDT